MELVIDERGQVRCIYDETLALASLGRLSIKRASHVEPDEGGLWMADLEYVHGPRLGPFGLRSEALAAEHAWLTANWLNGPLTK